MNMDRVVISVRVLWHRFWSTKKSIICSVCMVLLITGVTAQEVTYDVISTMGTIVDKRSGKALQVGDQVSFHTELIFSNPHDRAVLLSPSKSKFFLELPKTSESKEMTVASIQALTPVKPRPALITGTRGNSVLAMKGVSPQSLQEYFGPDVFTVIGPSLKMPVTKGDEGKFDLLFRYEDGNLVKEYLSTDFTMSPNNFKLQGNGISECYVLLKDGNQTVFVTMLSLFFIDKDQLFGEFNAYLKTMGQKKIDDGTVRKMLRQYCTDIYGMIDNTSLETALNEYLK